MNDHCQFPEINATTDEIHVILKTTHTIAVVGISDKPERPSYRVAAYLKEKGYRIFPVNPLFEKVLGETAYAGLDDIPEKIDTVTIFRKPEHVPEIVNQAIKKGAQTIWMQEGIVHNDAAKKARDSGLRVVMDKCMMKEHIASSNRHPDNV